MDEFQDELLDTYCWIHSTYTVTSAFYKQVGVEVPFPGVDNTRGSAKEVEVPFRGVDNKRATEKEIKVYRFYQWVPFCLLFQVRADI
jgi:hypothetical protein